ncbi:MAG: aminotransferase class I/II-fold pyridoxal phosphate-dependent enzyme [Bdellovibrionales bacterium]|nr:aminotransferase class I/II-fold pyridoxal phosphate-dependent enzyme [Bdellovibrionales bacterium]
MPAMDLQRHDGDNDPKDSEIRRSQSESRFEHSDPPPPDKIFGIIQLYKNDKRPSQEKLNLAVGVRLGNGGQPPQRLGAFGLASKVYEENEHPVNYQSQRGNKGFCEQMLSLPFGDQIALDSRVAHIQTNGGTGALHDALKFHQLQFPDAKVAILGTSWPNYTGIIENVRGPEKLLTVPLYDRTTRLNDEDSFLEAIKCLPENCALLFDPMGQNPTGIDLTPEGISKLAQLLSTTRKDILLIADVAYLGLHKSIKEDAAHLRLLQESGLEFFLSLSASKTLSAYNSRLGVLAFFSTTEKGAQNVQAILERKIVRGKDSNRSYPDAEKVRIMLSHPELRESFLEELEEGRQLLTQVKANLADKIEENGYCGDLTWMRASTALFSLIGLSTEFDQIAREKYGLFMPDGGRICYGAIHAGNIDLAAEKFAGLLAEWDSHLKEIKISGPSIA